MQTSDAQIFLRDNACLSQNLQTYSRTRHPIPAWVLDQINANLPEYLGALDQLGDTLTHLHVLSTLMHECDAGAAAWAYVVPSMSHLLTHMDTSRFSVWYSELYAAVDRYTEFLFAQNSATTCIRPILAGLRSVKSVVPADSLLPLHRMFMKAVLISGFGHLAQEFIDTPLTNVSRTHVTSKDVLLYYYYASLVCIVQKAYEKAYGCLSMVLAMPCETPTPITVKAYKLLLLVSLLHNHEPLHEKSLYIADPNQCKVYHQIASYYAKGDETRLRDLIQSKQTQLEDDGTYVLSQLCLHSLPLAKAARLTTTYLMLSLGEISDTVGLGGPEEAELLVLKMIEKGRIHAKINQANGTVSFDESPQDFGARDTTLLLNAQIESLIKLNQSVLLADQHVQDTMDLAKVASKSRPFDNGHGSDSAGSYATN